MNIATSAILTVAALLGHLAITVWLFNRLHALGWTHSVEVWEATETGRALRIYSRGKLRDAIKAVQDLERLVARAALGTAGPRDLVGLKHSLAVIPRLRTVLSDLQAPLVDLHPGFLVHGVVGVEPARHVPKMLARVLR